jgi:endonuclease/exonuclease/phosphatase family metal-dependent hydrolase
MSNTATPETSRAAIRQCRLPKVTAFFALALSALASAPALADDDGHTLRVMTQNLYVGTMFTELLAAKTPSEIISAATLTYQNILATKPAERVAVIAEEIARHRPDLVGLEQVAIVRTGITPPATTVTFDHLQILLKELAAKGMRYETVAVEPGLDAEAPTLLGFDVRVTLRNALIVRSALLEDGSKVSNLQIRQYIAQTHLVTPGGVVTDNTGYAAVDVTLRGRKFRFVTTHFDVSPTAGLPQAVELVQTGLNTTLPVVLVCDCNSPPDLPTHPNYPPYQVLKNAGFVDAFRTKRPNDPGLTCCQAENLINLTSALSFRIDLVQFRGPFTVKDVQVVGASPADRARLGLWPSDHAGVVATLTLPPGN